MRQTHGEDADLAAGTATPVDDTSGTNMVTPFRNAMRCSKFLLTVVVTGGSITGALYGYTARNAGKWGIHRVADLDGSTLAEGSYHFPVVNFGGYPRAAFVHATAAGAPTVATYLTEIIEGPMTIGD